MIGPRADRGVLKKALSEKYLMIFDHGGKVLILFSKYFLGSAFFNMIPGAVILT